MITFKNKGDFSHITYFLKSAGEGIKLKDLAKYGQAGVNALRDATPVDSGKTAESWKYDIDRSKDTISITFYNTNVSKGIPIVILLQYGHGTRNGGWVEGRDFINPAIQPVFDKIAEDAWKEVTRK